MDQISAEKNQSCHLFSYHDETKENTHVAVIWLMTGSDEKLFKCSNV